MNPLLAADAKPDFPSIRPEHVTPALDVLLADAEAALAAVTGGSVPADYHAVSKALDVPLERLRRAWTLVSHLQAVADTLEQRAAYTGNQPRVTAFYTRLGADERLYTIYKAIAANDRALNDEQRQALRHALRDFVLGGAELKGAARQRHAEIQERAATLSREFGEHVLDATDAYAWYATEAEMAGVPDDVRAVAREAAAADGRNDLYKLTLQEACLRPLLRYAEDRSVRERLYRAYATRASEAGPPELDNGPLMRELVALRNEEARLLGYRDYAALALVPKMARTPDRVLDFVRDAARRSRPHAERDLAALREFATRELGLQSLEAWDLPYASEKLSQSLYAFSSDEVKRYFRTPEVLTGLFGLIESLFGVTFRPDTAPVWHGDVRFLELFRGERYLGALYLDLYARPGKQSGAWLDDGIRRWLRPDTGQLQAPVGFLVCNFVPPADGRPSLLSHDDLITLFHEFGHALHHLLTRVDDLAVSGIAGVEWDAVELPSQFMENYCWEYDVLQRLSSHVDTGQRLPRDLYERMRAARNFQSGWTMLRSCEHGLFDLRLHHEPGAGDDIERLMASVRDEASVLPPPPWQRFANTFTHIFDGGYAAGYYGYAWAEVLSADAYEAFEEAGILDPETGRRFREQVLEVGGSRDAMASFVAFRGREPRLDAWLRHQGLN
ncbi:MAG: M3 family metallopeptidase [Rubrivivax sp.]|nr:M3 family metallopeptidase [Rubrivivax sp.]